MHDVVVFLLFVACVAVLMCGVLILLTALVAQLDRDAQEDE